MEYRLNNNGLPFGNHLKKALEGQIKRIKENKASIIVIDSNLGAGKTTLAVHIADYLQGQQINLEEQLSMGGEDFQEKLQICQEKKHKVLIYDESGDLSKRAVLSKFNRNMMRIFDTFRTYRIIVVMCLPAFWNMDRHIYDNKVVRMLLHLSERRKNYGMYGCYSMSDIEWMFWHLKKLPIKSGVYTAQIPCFRERFEALTPERQNTLDKISHAAKKEILGKNIMKARGLKNLRELAKEWGVAYGTLKNNAGLNKIQADMKYKGANYYTEGAAERLFSTLKSKQDKIRGVID
jgi:hypothetical protein